MKSHLKSSIALLKSDRRGNISMIAAAWIAAFTGITGVTTDVSFYYYAKAKLQSATDAAALAAVQDINGASTDAQITATALAYSAVTGHQNADARFTVNSGNFSTTLKCFSTVANQGIPCVKAAGANTSANGIVVTQTASVPTYFAKIFGISSTTIKSVSTAAYKGGGTSNLDVFFVIDTTASMDSTTGANCGALTRINCALSGANSVITALKACSDASCTTGTGGVATNPVNQVGLIAFPPRSTISGNIAKDYDCSTSTTPVTMPYNTAASAMSYVVLPLQSDYKGTSTATTLNTSSNLARAVGGGGITCAAGLQAPGGQGSFLAGAIDAARVALTFPTSGTNTTNVRSASTKVIIVLSDGDAAASSSKVTTATNQCTQGVTAANTAKNAGILVYTIAYGAGSGGCSTDTGASATTACNSMKAMATVGSDSSKFFSTDGTTTGSSVCTSTNSYTSLSAIFNAIQGSISSTAGANPRLVPDSTT